ncbi:MAG: 30S ribosomal protein S16 [Anaerolineae bacterium]|nr:30S ribosomal protein S16 [Anaerolineae bacterium]
MLKIRLRRVGAKRQASYRIVVAESTVSRDGKFVEVIGFYNPRTEPETVKIKEDRALHWLSVGAQPTDAVARFFKRLGTFDRLARLHAGESLEDLAAEAMGEPPSEEEMVISDFDAEEETLPISEEDDVELDEATTVEEDL